jgi:type VI secretion system protein VasD
MQIVRGRVIGMTRRLALVSFCVLSLSGCAGDPVPKTTELRVQVVADDQINPNTQNDPSPVVLRIYELKSLTTFQQASFFDLLDDDTKALGQDLVAKREIEIKPGEKQAFDRKTPVDTHFVGVIAGFRVLDSAKWRASVEIEPEHAGAVVVKVTAQTVTIDLAKDKRFGIF